MQKLIFKATIALLFTWSGAAAARVIPEVRDFFIEESNLIGNSLLENEGALSSQDPKFRLSTVGIDIRGIVGFDAANSVNLQLIPDIELQFEREPEKKP